MDRKAVARETLNIMRQGYYEIEDGSMIKRIEVAKDMERSVSQSILITPDQGEEILRKYEAEDGLGGLCVTDWRNQKETPGRSDGMDQENQGESPDRSKEKEKQKEKLHHAGGGSDGYHEENRMRTETYNISTVDAIRMLAQEGRQGIGVLNFASAKNPGGGFINGAMAQEESLAASSTLYRTLTAHEEYYRENRARSSMMYTDYGIYSPDVTFFRDGKFKLVEKPVYASCLTLPAVNMGQVLLKGEDEDEAKRVMRRRMKLALAIFAEYGAKNLVLGAYGCGVFRNDPVQVAVWWKEIMEEGFERFFESVVYAVLDKSRGGACIRAFQKAMGELVLTP